MAIRNVSLFIATCSGSQSELQVFSTGARRRLPRPVPASQQPEHVPRVLPPSSSNSILNLFRVNTNFYSAAPQIHPAEKNEEQPPEDNLCTICVSTPADCIILQCKHAGICKQCSIAHLTKSTQCPFCRLQIDRICVVRRESDTQYRVIEEIER